MLMIHFILLALDYQHNAPKTSEVRKSYWRNYLIFIVLKLLHVNKINLRWLLRNYIFSEYMVNKLDIEENKVPDMCAQLYRDYGTTMAGLRVLSSSVNYPMIFKNFVIYQIKPTNRFSVQALGYSFDSDEYHRYRIFSFPFGFLRNVKIWRYLIGYLQYCPWEVTLWISETGPCS